MKVDIVKVRDRLSRLWIDHRISTEAYQRALQRTWVKMSDEDRTRELRLLGVR